MTRPDTHLEDQDPRALMRPAELGRRWGKSVRTLQRWRVDRKGPAWIRIGGSVFYRLGDVLDHEEAARQSGEFE